MKEFFTKHFEAFYLRLTGVNHTTLLIYEKLTFISQQLSDLSILIKETSCKKEKD